MGDLFDPLGAAEIAAGVVFDQLFEPERIARIHYQNPIPPGAGGADPTALPSLEAVLDATIEAALPSAGMPCARGAVSMTHYCELHND
jgi:hypothetical protein